MCHIFAWKDRTCIMLLWGMTVEREGQLPAKVIQYKSNLIIVLCNIFLAK